MFRRVNRLAPTISTIIRSSSTSTPSRQFRWVSSIPKQSGTMKVARVTAWGKAPEYTSVPELEAPSGNEVQLKVLAVGISRVVRGLALGKHYSRTNQTLPFDPSVDGVGLDEATGDMYYIPPFSGPLLAERVNVDSKRLFKIPKEADPVFLAGLVNPASSSWMALQGRVKGGCKGRNVFILGATSASGRLGARMAHELGAAKVIGSSRTKETLDAVEGLDERVILGDMASLPSTIGPVHIVLDYVGGKAAHQLLKSAEIEPGTELQYVHVGGLSGEDSFPWEILRQRPITVMGSGMGSWSMKDVMKEMPDLIRAICNIGNPGYVVDVPLSEVETAWNMEGKRLVLVP